MNRAATMLVVTTLLAFAAPPPARAAATVTTLAPVLGAREGWLNGPVAPLALENKVVLVDVFTFGCSNCQNVVPNLRKLTAARRDGFVVIGVHSPETPYERTRANVVASLRAQGISWPVAIDNSFAIWKAYGVEAWPTQLLFDRHGRLRQTFVGDSQDAGVDNAVDALLSEK